MPFSEKGFPRVVFAPQSRWEEVGTPDLVLVFADPDQVSALVTMLGFHSGRAINTIAPFWAACHSIVFAAEQMDDSRALDPIPTKEDVYTAALAQRPEIRAAKLQTEAADLQVDIAKRGYYPSIGVSAGIGASHYSADDRGWGEQMKRNLNGSVGLTVSVPIFDNRRNKTSLSRAKLSKTSAQLDLLDKQTTLGSTIENLWLQATSSQQRFRAAQVAVQNQETTYELTNEQFKAGLKNIVDLLQARDNLLQAQQNRLQSKYTTILNTQLLRFYEGGQLTI